MFVLSFLFSAPPTKLYAANPANSAVAQGAEALHITYKGEVAVAFSSTSEDGCLYKDIFVFVGEFKVKAAPGAPMSDKTVSAQINEYDVCSGEWKSGQYGYAPVNESNFQIDKKLNSAHIEATIPLQDWNGNSSDLAVNLTWTGIGDLFRNKSSYQNHSQGFTYHSRFTGTMRAATVSGSMIDGSIDYPVNSLFSGSLESVKGGEVVIFRN